MSARRRGQHGFTLLELLVAITLLGVLMAALFGALRLGTRVWETGEERLDATTRTQIAQDFLRRQLSQTSPLTEISQESRGSIALLFVGASDDVRFVSVLPAYLGAGVTLMEVGVRQPARDGGPADLVLRVRPLDLLGGDDTDTGAAEPEQRVLIDSIASLEIAYFGPARAGAEPSWWQEWQNQRALPLLVRIRVHFAPGDTRRWPELIVAPMVDLPPPFQL